MTNSRIVGVVLAGGDARRIGGGDKPLLTIGGRTMLEAVIDALGVPTIAISANGDPARFATFGPPVLSDGPFIGQGPLAGLCAGLTWAVSQGASALLSAPGDMPFLPRGLADLLSPAPCAVRSGGRHHHLVAVWPIDCLPVLRNMLAVSESRRVADFASRIGMRYHDFSVRAGDPFANINTQNELARARGEVGDG
jgi:molybdenum cofactor guanylyltransferase